MQVAALASAERARALADAVGGTVTSLGALHRVRIGPLPAGVVNECGPIKGTIAVADDSPDAMRLARISAEDAARTATASMPGSSVRDNDLDEEDGYLVYEVEIVKDHVEYDVIIDAGSGAILCTERD